MKKLILFLLLPWGWSAFAQSDWRFTAALDSMLFPKGPDLSQPGFAVCIVQNGTIVYERETGLANVKMHLPITPSTMFNIGSVTKQFTAACILLLEERGQLNRADSIQKYIPELPDFEHTITLHHLLSHTSGLHDHLEVLVLQNRYHRKSICTPETMLKFLNQAPLLAFEPGTDYAYCNTGYMLLNLVVERVSGMPMKDFAEQNLFRPLDMSHTNFQYDAQQGLPDGTVSYAFKSGKKKFTETRSDYNAMGATGVHCTLRDFVVWDQNFYHNRLSPTGQKWVAAMETPYHLNNGVSTHYGAGLFVRTYRGIPVVDHSGGWDNFLTQYRRFPELGLSIIVASNNDASSPFPICDKICDKILTFNPLVKNFDSRIDALKIPVQALEGSYLSDNNRLRQGRLVHDTLKILFLSPSKRKAVSLSLDVERSSDTTLFFLDESGDTVQFCLNPDKTIREFIWEGGDYFRCKRAYRKLETPENTNVKQWAGKYHSAELQQTVRVRYKRHTQQLKLCPVFFVRYTLVPLADNTFSVAGEKIIVRFSPDGLVLGHDWLQNLKLQKIN